MRLWGSLLTGLGTAQEFLTSDHSSVDGLLNLASGVGLSLGSAAAAVASGHWARDVLCSAVGVIGASIWIGLWSRLARCVRRTGTCNGRTRDSAHGCVVHTHLASAASCVRFCSRTRGFAGMRVWRRDGHVDPKVSRKLVHCGRHARKPKRAQTQTRAHAPLPLPLPRSLSSPSPHPTPPFPI